MLKKDEFDDTAESKAYISSDQAELAARQLAMEGREVILAHLGWEEVVWLEFSIQQREDSYRAYCSSGAPYMGSTMRTPGKKSSLLT